MYSAAVSKSETGCWDSKRFLDPVNAANRECAVCLGVIKDCYSLACGHAFGKNCILQAIKRKPECPICRVSCEKLSIIKCPPLNLEISGLNVRCNNYEQGCNFQGTLLEVTNRHEIICMFNRVCCPHCNEKIYSYELEEHSKILRCECSKNYIACLGRMHTHICQRGCGKILSLASEIVHQSTCSYRDVSCANCSLVFPANKATFVSSISSFLCRQCFGSNSNKISSLLHNYTNDFEQLHNFVPPSSRNQGDTTYLIPCKWAAYGCQFKAQNQRNVEHEADMELHLQQLYNQIK